MASQYPGGADIPIILRHPLTLAVLTVLGTALAGCAAVLALGRDVPPVLGSSLAAMLVLAGIWIRRLSNRAGSRAKVGSALFSFGVLLMAVGTIPATMLWIVRGKPELTTAGGWLSAETAVMTAGAVAAAIWTCSAFRRKG